MDKEKGEERCLLPRHAAPQGRDRLNKMFELERFLQKGNRAASLKNAIDDPALQAIRQDDDLQFRIHLPGSLANLFGGSVGQLQVQKHEIEFLLAQVSHGGSGGSDHGSAEACFPQQCPKLFLQVRIVLDH